MTLNPPPPTKDKKSVLITTIWCKLPMEIIFSPVHVCVSVWIDEHTPQKPPSDWELLQKFMVLQFFYILYYKYKRSPNITDPTQAVILDTCAPGIIPWISFIGKIMPGVLKKPWSTQIQSLVQHFKIHTLVPLLAMQTLSVLMMPAM